MEDRRRPLRVALLSYRGNMFCGGQGVYLVNLAKALAGRGHHVTVIAGPPYPEEVPGANNVRLPGYNFINKKADELPPEDPLSVFEPLNFYEYLAARCGQNPEMLAFSLRCFNLLCRGGAGPVDIVHDNQGLGYGLLALRALGIPVVATIHHPLQVDRAEDIRQTGGLVAKMKRAVYYPIMMQREVAKRLDRAIAVSEFSADLVARTYGLGRGRMAVAPNGVDRGFFAPIGGVGREPGRLLFVGSTEDRKKGVIYLLEALAALPERFKLIIVDGRRYPGRVYAENAARRLGLSGRVEFRDRIGNGELALEYARAEMMVVPSLFEGFGLPALEAMAAGVPLVCSSAGALPEVVGNEAVLVRPRSVLAIRDAVLSLSGDEEKLWRLSRSGRERAARVFSWDRSAALVEDVYYEALGTRGLHRG